MRRALVLGGTGVVGREVVRELRGEGVDVTFSFHRSEEQARRLEGELGARPVRIDLASADELPSYLAGLGADAPEVAIHCAGMLVSTPVTDTPDDAWERSYAVNARSAFHLCRGLGAAMRARGGGDIVFVGGLDRTQSLPVPTAWAASQGLLSAMVMAAAKELGPAGVRVNMVALGLLGEGLSTGLPERVKADYLAFSALRRNGTAAEAAKLIAWLATKNTFVTGKVVGAHGGI
jgi:3-oxoacyl-[acyl-carrier protein] reductase